MSKNKARISKKRITARGEAAKVLFNSLVKPEPPKWPESRTISEGSDKPVLVN